MPSSPHAQANPTAVRPQSSGNELLAVPKRHVWLIVSFAPHHMSVSIVVGCRPPQSPALGR